MPLIKSSSKKALTKNIETEMKANPEPEKHAQNLAIAFSVQRKNKAKKMADGGEVEPETIPDYSHGGTKPNPKYKSDKLPGSSLPPSGKQDTGYVNKAYGGVIGAEDDNAVSPEPRKPDDHRLPEDEYMADHFSEGGDVEHESMVDAIMAHRAHAKLMADGGEVDLEANALEGPGEDDTQNLEASKKESYDDRQISAQPDDSNEHGDNLADADENDRDMVSAIIRKLKNKAA
jgi:hypothetical protein